MRSASRVVAELTGTGPLEPYMSDPSVEEIDVNSHLSTWVTYADGRKVDVGSLWESRPTSPPTRSGWRAA